MTRRKMYPKVGLHLCKYAAHIICYRSISLSLHVPWLFISSKQAWQTTGLEQMIQSRLQQHNDINNIIFAIFSGTESGRCLGFKALQV
ncbi:hypothetical protein P8452_12068 [Trifolium repens]|nr:hypothetical protein P8452_12068 [Trifolium repens]